MEKDFLAGQGERERITSIQFCSAALCLPHDSPATHSSPAGGSARHQHPVAPCCGSCSSSVVAGTWQHRGHRAPAVPRLRPLAPGMCRAAGLWWLKQALRWGLQSPRFSAASEPLGCPAAISMHPLPAQSRPLSSPSHVYSLSLLHPHCASPQGSRHRAALLPQAPSATSRSLCRRQKVAQGNLGPDLEKQLRRKQHHVTPTS